ncbi:hypothetical protein SMACR_03771 [Sordaria macrospora]|uniref:RING-CH-type domain-containing protein n=1 Tax=Sordaria macrospora TaxID=5147 RepID=A0A8S8ZCI7_SORMA|nr:hypothetical protein SMACR_03771 [Sordaria macrospora]KAH7631328.1 hypothetical protein B0T09DRAFT_262737 [Sordaria sp. MPI-SDFR-AT-0083]WPJ61590.1 hypothetical protein SMAC4_03771 [Sordaria macrospora]
MATPDTGSQAASAPVPNPLTRSDTNTFKRCCICFEDEGERTTEPVVRPCTCSFPVHETCLLRWYEENHNEKNNRDGVSCPQCKAPFKVEEPFDYVVALRRTIHRKFSQVSPIILASMVASGTFASSATYGVIAASSFAGYETALRWVGLQVIPGQAISVSGARSAQVGRMMMRLWTMSSIAPAVILSRAVPFLANFFFVPFSAMYGILLIAQDDHPTWPPSPTWAMVMMPYVHMTYNRLYNYWLRPIDRRLNRALRGLENNLTQPTDGAAGATESENNHDNENRDRESRFILSDLLDLGRTAWIILSNTPDDGGAELDVRIEIGANADSDNDAADRQLEDSFLQVDAPEAPYTQYNEEIAGHLEEAIGQVREVPWPAEAEAEARPPTPTVPEPAPAPAAAPPPQPAARARRERNNNNDRDRDGVELPPFSLTDIVNNVVTSLLFPFISYGMGELIRLALPKSWTSPPKPIVTSGFFKRGTILSQGPGGLLQQRWGRSLAGGCLFVVIRDVFELYAKYRNVQVMKGRRIVRRREGGDRGDRGGGFSSRGRAADAGAGAGNQ